MKFMSYHGSCQLGYLQVARPGAFVPPFQSCLLIVRGTKTMSFFSNSRLIASSSSTFFFASSLMAAWWFEMFWVITRDPNPPGSFHVPIRWIIASLKMVGDCIRIAMSANTSGTSAIRCHRRCPSRRRCVSTERRTGSRASSRSAAWIRRDDRCVSELRTSSASRSGSRL